MPHQPGCCLCVEGLDVEDHVRTATNLGLIATKLSANRLNVSKMNDTGTTVLFHAELDIENSSFKVFIGTREVTQFHKLNDVQELFNLLTVSSLCPGNEGFEDVLSERRTSDEHQVVFQGQDNDIVAFEESGTVRHKQCVGFVASGMCAACLNYKNVLRKFRSRAKEPKHQLSCSSHTRNDLLSQSQLRTKVEMLQASRQSLKRKNTSLEQKYNDLIQSDSVPVSPQLSDDLMTVMTAQKLPEGSMQKVFWEQQLQCLQRNRAGYRWHPSVIRLCIALHSRSHAAYECLRKSGVLTLPSSKTLRDYTNFTKPTPGLNAEIVKRIATDCMLMSLPDFKRNVIIAFDEIHIKQGLVYDSNTKELVGWTDLGDINNEITNLINDKLDAPKLANHIMSFMVRGLFIRLNQVFAYYPSTGFTSYDLYHTVWEAVLLLEQVGFRCRGLVSDGASPNRKFYRIHQSEESSCTFYAQHPIRKSEKVYFFCDVPHLIKTTRNCWENSGWHSKTRHLEVRTTI